MYSQGALGIDLGIDEAFGNWLAGFTAGEGCFGFYPSVRVSKGKYRYRSCRTIFTISLRLDDVSTLIEIRDRLSCGNLRVNMPRSRKNTNPTAVYEIANVDTLKSVIIPLFIRFPLRAKKGLEFKIWKVAVETTYMVKHSFPRVDRNLPDHVWEHLLDLKRLMDDLRDFDNTEISSLTKLLEDSV